MARDDAYRQAEQKIEAARRTGVKELDLSCRYDIINAEKLTELPESLGKLTRLQTLNLSNNRLTALPESLGKLTRLQTLNLSINRLTVLPEWLGQLTQLQTLNLSGNHMTALPEWLGKLTQLQTLDVSRNQLKMLPESLGQITHLQTLVVFNNELTTLPESLGQLSQLQTLDLFQNQLTELPKSFSDLVQLRVLSISANRFSSIPTWLGELERLETLGLIRNHITELPESLAKLTQLRAFFVGESEKLKHSERAAWKHETKLTSLPAWVGRLKHLEILGLEGNNLTDLPSTLCELVSLRDLRISNNPLNAELAAADKQGLKAIKAYLRAKAEDSVVLNEVKLILIGEGDVGKSSLLGALRGDEWVENRKTTHGVEVDIKSFVLTDPDSGTEITFNGWDFGGQNIYRHTHQLFFTAPAVYLAVWNPRRGPEQCCVDEWIKMVKHRAYDETRPNDRPRILIVATHGGPQERPAHIDEQLLRDEFGDLIVGFHHVDSNTGFGLDELKTAIARTAASISSVGRSVPASWKNMLDALRKRSEKDAYITFTQFQALCHTQKITNELANMYAAMLNELGHLVHYRGDADLQEIVILKPEWLSKAISYVLEDKTVGQQNGLVQHDRLSAIWNDPQRTSRERYPNALHPVFLKLMERFDLSYRVVMPQAGAPETSLVAQLVPGGRPEGWEQDWPPEPEAGDTARTQVCRIVDSETGRTAEVEGLLYRLIVRLHRYSLGRSNYFESRHWKTGLILDADFNGRAFVEEIAGDVHVTVRAAYPERFLTHLCSEIEWLVDHFWKGLDCWQSVPCHVPCKGLHEVKALVETKREGIPKVRCSVCGKFHAIDLLLATVTPKPAIEVALAELKRGQDEIKQGVAAVSVDLRRLISQADEQFDLLMTALTDPAKDGPRLFSFEPVEPGFWDKPNWIAQKFRLTLWCEHSRLPLPAVKGETKRGVYELELTRDWIKNSAPFLRVLSTTLSLALPIASSATKLVMDATAYKAIENQLDFGKACAESFLKAGEKVGDWLTTNDDTEMEPGLAIRAQGATLRELHSLLKEQDPASSFGGLNRVQNKRREFLWVHEKFKHEY
ncbi:MAG: COR domain-containing protein [Planctomycetota bacterium]